MLWDLFKYPENIDTHENVASIIIAKDTEFLCNKSFQR